MSIWKVSIIFYNLVVRSLDHRAIVIKGSTINKITEQSFLLMKCSWHTISGV